MRVLIDSRFAPEIDGGVQQVIEGLAKGFARQPAGGSSFTFLTRHPVPASLVLRTSQNPKVRALTSDVPASTGAQRLVRRVAPARRAASWLVAHRREHVPDCPVDETEFDVVHLALQNGFRTSLPYVYSPYDLQHLHLPEFFTRAQREARARVYGALARDASGIVVHTAWSASDICARLGLPPDKVYVIPLGVQSVEPLDPLTASRIRATLGVVDGDYALYPAQTWPHKNHLGLLACLAKLRDEGVAIPLVCTGTRNSFYQEIDDEVARLRLAESVRFTGFVTDQQMQALYAGARCLLFPSRFEGWGMPIFDALAQGVPVAATNRCGLGELLNGAAMTFDPSDLGAMAVATRSIWLDEDVRRATAQAGRALASSLTWDQTCRTLEAVYRMVGGFAQLDGDTDRLTMALAWPTQLPPDNPTKVADQKR